jgi:hypothetical protein
MDKNLSRGISDTIKLTLPRVLTLKKFLDKNFTILSKFEKNFRLFR